VIRPTGATLAVEAIAFGGTSMLRQDIDPFKVSSPRIFLVRMLVFLVIGALLAVILNRQIWAAFQANPALNALIIGILLIGIVLSFRQVIRLFPEIAWVNSFRLADPGLAVERGPVLLAPMAAILRDRAGRMAMSSQTMRGMMDSIANRLDGLGKGDKLGLIGLQVITDSFRQIVGLRGDDGTDFNAAYDDRADQKGINDGQGRSSRALHRQEAIDQIDQRQ